jgi:hypothetical protein
MKQSCEKLTSVIQDLQTLLPRVDSAIRKFQPEDGMLVKGEVMRVIEPCLFRIRISFRSETYEYLIQVLGSETELKNRTAIVKTTGKSGVQLEKELEKSRVDSKNIELWNEVRFMLHGPDFELTRAGEIVQTVRLQLRALFSDEYNHTNAEVFERASQLGLGILPHEVAADLILDGKHQPELAQPYIFASRPITGRSGGGRFFGVERNLDNAICLSSNRAGVGVLRSPATEFIFCIRKPKF